MQLWQTVDSQEVGIVIQGFVNRSRANQPCVVTVSVGTVVPETKMGRTYLRPVSGTY